MNCQQSSELDNVKEDNFLLFNALMEKEAIIKKVYTDLDMFKTDYGLTDLARDYYVIDPVDFVDEFEDFLKDKQDYLLKQSRAYNKIKNKYNMLVRERNAIKKNINELLDENKKKEDNKNRNEYNTKPNTSENDRNNNDATIENEKQTGEYEPKQDEEVDLFEDADIELNSDDEGCYETKLFDLKMLTNTYEDKVKSQVPKIDLKQIEFNKMKIKPEIDINSLERRDNNESVDSQIRLINNKIKVLKKRKTVGDEKIVKYSDYFEKLSKNLGNNGESRSSLVYTASNYHTLDLNSNIVRISANNRNSTNLTNNTYIKTNNHGQFVFSR